MARYQPWKIYTDATLRTLLRLKRGWDYAAKHPDEIQKIRKMPEDHQAAALDAAIERELRKKHG